MCFEFKKMKLLKTSFGWCAAHVSEAARQMVAVARMKGIARALVGSAAARRTRAHRTLGDFTDELMAELRRHTAAATVPAATARQRPAVVLVRRASVHQEIRQNEGQRDACTLPPPASVMLADPVAPPTPPMPLPPPSLELLDVELELGCDEPSDPLPNHEPPKPSQAGGLGGVAGEGGTSGSSPAAGCLIPQVCAQRPPQPHSHALCPLALFALAFVLVWLVAWVGFVVAPPPVLITGSALGDAFGVFVVPVLALLRFAGASVSQYVGDLRVRWR